MRYLLGLACALLALGAAGPNQGKVDVPVMQVKGYLVPVRLVQITSEVSGQIMAMHCDEGTQVKKGDVLARLDPRLYEIELGHAEAVVERARARFVLNKGKLEKSELDIAEAQRDKTRYFLEQTQIRAPFDGTVLTKKADVGGFLDRRQTNGYYALCELADLSQMEVDLWIPEVNMRLVFLGQKCTIRTDLDPKETYAGAVSRILPTADRARGAIGVRVRLDLTGKSHNLRPDMAAVVGFLSKE